MNLLNNKKVLLLGNGCHRDRYKYAFLFNDLPFDCFSNIDMLSLPSAVEFICICEPFIMNDEFEKIINRYKTKVLIEKLPFKDIKQLRNFLSRVSSSICIPICSRLFENKVIHNSDSSNVLIEWPNLTDMGMNSLWHTLPNILDFLVRQYEIRDISLLQISKVQAFERTIELVVNATNTTFIINIFSANENHKVRINGREIEWPNFLVIYSRIIEFVANENFDNKEMWEYIEGEIKFILECEELLKNES